MEPPATAACSDNSVADDDDDDDDDGDGAVAMSPCAPVGRSELRGEPRALLPGVHAEGVARGVTRGVTRGVDLVGVARGVPSYEAERTPLRPLSNC
jgi:hypothetical protein